MSLLSEEGRRQASADFYNKLKNDPRYEVVGGRLQLRIEETILTLKSNLEFYMSDIADINPDTKIKRIKHGYIMLLNSMGEKIHRDHCR
jgi:hypothetical protein